MAKFRRGNFVFVTWKGDHSPRHVHVYANGKLVVKWDLDAWVSMRGKADARLMRLLAALRKEGLL